MRKVLFALLVLGLAFTATSCRSFQITGVEVSQAAVPGDVVGTFDTTIWVNKFLGRSGGVTLFNITADATDPLIIDEIRRQIVNMGGTRAINVTIENTATAGQMFLSLLSSIPTFGYLPIWGPSTVRIMGTVVR